MEEISATTISASNAVKRMIADGTLWDEPKLAWRRIWSGPADVFPERSKTTKCAFICTVACTSQKSIKFTIR
jgi:hypothetical protein